MSKSIPLTDWPSLYVSQASHFTPEARAEAAEAALAMALLDIAALRDQLAQTHELLAAQCEQIASLRIEAAASQRRHEIPVDWARNLLEQAA